MKTKDLVKILKSNKSSAGFTLIELIIASFISIIVIGAAGFGLMAMLRGNKTASIEADRRTEINRALEFISDEIRRAETIDTDPNPAFTNAKDDYSYSFDPEDSSSGKNEAQPILALNIPGVTAPVLYYISPPESTAWQGPRVIYRFGPSYNNDGSYSNPTAPAKWVVEPLVDRIDDDSSGSLSASCPSGFTASTGAAIQGFYACVEDDGETAQIYMVGQLENGDTYQADIQVYARAEEENLTSSSPELNFNPLEGISSSSKLFVKNLVSSMGCNSSGDPCSITTDFKQNGKTTTIASNETEKTIEIDPTQAFTVTVTPSKSSVSNPFTSDEQNNTKSLSIKIENLLDDKKRQITALNDSTSTPQIETQIEQVKLLSDTEVGDFLNYDAWNPKANPKKFKSIKQELKDLGYVESDSVTLPPKNYILLFEIGQSNETHEGFDLQDKVMLITIK